MEFGSQFVYVPSAKAETEEIFEGIARSSSSNSPGHADEIEDGIAAAAMDQAKLWAEAAKEEGSIFDPDFVRTLMQMVSSS
jgi:hypothetical protein